MNIPSNITTLIAGITLTLVSLWVGQHHGLLPVAASDEAPLVDGLFNLMMTIATGLFILVQGALLIAAIKFRRRPGDDTDGPPVHGNLPLEALWTGIPVIIVLGISIYSFEVYTEMGGLDPMASHDTHVAQVVTVPGSAIAATLSDTDLDSPEISKDPDNQQPEQLALGVGAPQDREGQVADVVVNVEAVQFGWVFKYPNPNSEDPIYAGQLYLPANREVQLNITARDVLHAFWVPEFRLKQDAIPGRTAELRFMPKVPGTYSVICAELCGAYHGSMRTQTIVQTPEEFDAWYQSQIQTANNADTEATVTVANQNSTVLDAYARDLGIDAQDLAQLQLERNLPTETPNLSEITQTMPAQHHHPHAHVAALQ